MKQTLYNNEIETIVRLQSWEDTERSTMFNKEERRPSTIDKLIEEYGIEDQFDEILSPNT